jgi:hypothetical protein
MTKHPDITIPGRPAGYDRFKVAYEIQDACNPSGVARELVRVVEDATRDPACTGTDWVRSDAAVVAVVDKLRDLMGLDAFEALRTCREKAETAKQEPAP